MTSLTRHAGDWWAGRNVLVTGAGGFIGSHLVERLVGAGANVRAFVRYTSRREIGNLAELPSDVLSEIEIYPGDLVNPEAMLGAVAGREVVFHLGALIPIPYSYRHPREYVAANVTGTLNVLEACRHHGVRRLVHTSSSEVYGTAQTVPISELHPLHAQSPYAATKIGADQLALTFQLSFGTPVVVVRPFNTFGPRQSMRAVIPTVVAQALARDVVELGATGTTRDFLYVADTAAGIASAGAAQSVEGEVINLGTGVEISIEEAVRRVLAALGRELPLAVDEQRLRPPSSEVERLVADVSKARALLQWEPAVSFDDGLQRTIDWVSRTLDRVDPQAYAV